MVFVLLFTDETGASIEKPMATLVYIHGESYEWNSGNLYDGTVLAAHSNIIVVTINFRIGVLGEFEFLPSLTCVWKTAQNIAKSNLFSYCASIHFRTKMKKEIFHGAKFIAHTNYINK